MDRISTLVLKGQMRGPHNVCGLRFTLSDIRCFRPSIQCQSQLAPLDDAVIRILILVAVAGVLGVSTCCHQR